MYRHEAAEGEESEGERTVDGCIDGGWLDGVVDIDPIGKIATAASEECMNEHHHAPCTMSSITHVHTRVMSPPSPHPTRGC